ncbi:Zn-ribbon domain-containing OB-fold protein [Amycolatopsis pithecellobii]|uniref:DNA-binding protein n=1 Tax=Amycolatopsis pithecellobii TaxID=664692 RepID=A0A6N7YMS6_9PSEU|nr:zinc ribbon domain-containing protein [Amycolatopsis pithecellobii]MTD53168.1 hypothetical protein [Amycolatopsis pithecellobii]
MRPSALPAWERYPTLPVDEDNLALYEGWLDHEFRLPQCVACGKWHAPAHPLCPFCWSFDLAPRKLSGRGTVHLSILLHQGPAMEGVTYPYPVVTVELEEQKGLRFTSTAVGGTGLVPIGTPVELVWLDRGGAPFPAFRPRQGARA